MIRSSSRKVKPTTKFVEFELTSNGKKRGRPRKIVNTHNDTDPNIQHQANQSFTPVQQAHSQSFAHASSKEEPQPHIEEQKTPSVIQQELSLPSTPQQQTPVRPKREPKTQPTPTPTAVTRVESNIEKIQNNQTSTPIREPRSTTKPISSRKEELMRLRDENITLKARLDQLSLDYEELKRQTSYTGLTVPKADFDDLKERYQRDVAHAKKHEWCIVCLTQSKYHCCWNTTYCSQKCQVADWYARHGKTCERRKSLLRNCAL